MFCEDCENYTRRRKEYNGLLLCSTCYEMRSGKPFIIRSQFLPDHRKRYVGSKKRRKLELMVKKI